jgi:predicted anti-sigma-YlaC factor YlaD
MPNPCAATRQWISAAPDSSGAIIPDHLVDHVAACPRCRGALAVLVAQFLTPPSADEPIDCQMCEDTLAAFFDHEHAFGLTATIGVFPAVWWHLLICPACGAFYDDLCDLLTISPDLACAPAIASP